MNAFEWRVITSRRQTGSPGSGEWVDYLCVRRKVGGHELAICGFELDEHGQETEALVLDPSVSPADLSGVDEQQIVAALNHLNWTLADVGRVAAAIGE